MFSLTSGNIQDGFGRIELELEWAEVMPSGQLKGPDVVSGPRLSCASHRDFVYNKIGIPLNRELFS